MRPRPSRFTSTPLERGARDPPVDSPHPPGTRTRRRRIAGKEKMKTFDPWPVFFRREWSRNWPFLTGFAITGYLIVKMTANFTEEDLKNSKFVQEHKKH
ncbi:hypothetical protein EJB05_14928, partial [Eragrostis curvula]